MGTILLLISPRKGKKNTPAGCAGPELSNPVPAPLKIGKSERVKTRVVIAGGPHAPDEPVVRSISAT